MATALYDVFSPTAMADVDRQTIQQGTPGTLLMQRAGSAVARLCLSLRGRGSARILCGPGNNGGDGWIAARVLLDAGWDIDVCSLVDPATLSGDAAWAARGWLKAVTSLEDAPAQLPRTDIFIDAAFGGGLNRPISEQVAAGIQAAHAAADTSIAVDIPSGIDGATGEDRAGIYSGAEPLVFDHCITFGARRFGHVLLPGKAAYTKLWIVDIGLSQSALAERNGGKLNTPIDTSTNLALTPKPHVHKYMRGHVGVVCGAPGKSGAGKLAALAALKAGAGLVTLLHRGAIDLLGMPASVMHASWPDPAEFQSFLNQRKISTVVVGPGLGLDPGARALCDAALSAAGTAVFDADALTIIAAENWLHRLTQHAIITPHEGEFRRLLPSLDGPKIRRFTNALKTTPAVICLKGADTLIGRGGASKPIINDNAPPNLAVAGSGDMLAGLIAAVLGPGTDPLHAAQIGVYVHALTGQLAGTLGRAEDFLRCVPAAIAQYKADLARL
ncbi:MAG: NAD(P)H-hydrate dehydratase [Pseudomonadota bacterium]